MENQYKVVSGISFDARTPDKVCNILASHCGGRNQRVRIFLGDTTTGKDWCEVYDTIGYIGRSTGNIKIPLMILRKDSWGGGAILDHCIVKITISIQTITALLRSKEAPFVTQKTERFSIEDLTEIFKPWNMSINSCLVIVMHTKTFVEVALHESTTNQYL